MVVDRERERQDKRVRQALSLAIDRQGAEPGRQRRALRADEPAVQPRQFLSQRRPSGSRPRRRQGQGPTKEGQSKVSVELFVTNNPVDAQLGQVIQAMAQEAGIDIQIRSTEFASQLRDQQQGKFQMSRIGWSGRIDPDGNIHFSSSPPAAARTIPANTPIRRCWSTAAEPGPHDLRTGGAQEAL